MNTFETYLCYKTIERFLDSLMLAKPVPHFVAAKHDAPRKNPFGLERVASFLKALDSPQRQNRYIHIAGTSGKTSTTYLTAALLQSQGYVTARFTSPHIMTFAEYFTIDNHLPTVPELVALVEQAKPFIDQEYETQGLGMISYAEVILSLAFQYFANKSVDYVALEAFLGGRYDATNVIDQAEVSVLTNVGLDHTHILGDTVEEIASDKIGIMKMGCPFITAEQRPELLAMFQDEAAKHHASIEVLGQDFIVEHVNITPTGSVFDYVSETHTYRALQIPLPGAYQAYNAALALRTLEIVAWKNQQPLDEYAVRYALRMAHIPGRCETVCHDPVVILDAAHNPDKMAQFTTLLKQLYQPEEVLFVCACTTSGKQLDTMFRPMLEVSHTFYLTRTIIGYREDEEPLYLKSVLTHLDANVDAYIALDPFRALELAMYTARKQHKVVCVTGSGYLVGLLRQRWYPEYEIVQAGEL
jgi:dihydrofolate synthase/folylpolyglutamate synthase